MRHLASFAAACVLFAAAHEVAAGGLELLPPGARSVARGGAVAARPEDPLALLHNPAGLAFLSGSQVIVGADAPLHHMCVTPYGYYGWGIYGAGSSEFGDPLAVDNPSMPTIGANYATTPLGQVCNSARVVPIPQLAVMTKITDDIAIGGGLVAPLVVAGLQYGGTDGTQQTPYGPRPTPTRYSIIAQDADFALAPSIGGAYRVLPELSFGINVQIAMLKANTTMVQNNFGGTQPSTDWLVKIKAQDFFTPSITFAVHARPRPQLNLMGAFRWVDNFRGTGELTYETNTFHRGATAGPVPYQNPPVKLSDVVVRLPWQITMGARYAGLLPDVDCEPGPGDPMDTELWDIELDLGYSLNARASNTSASIGQDVTVVTRTAGGGAGSNTVPLKDLAAFDIDHHLKDSASVRLGGSYAVLPRKLVVHAGGFFESRGVDPAYADIDAFAFQRVGVGVGLVVRLGSFDLQGAYGHIFSETLDVAPPPHQAVDNAVAGDPRSGFDKRVGGSIGSNGSRVGGVVLDDPKAPALGNADAVAAKTQQSAVVTPYQPNRVINAGKYEARFDVVSVGVVYHF
ncbi:MAG TPA: hypothetical protein VK550_02945 [Polyangiaceae bacterium]|nr:hypothetical protein [Polyangiaceae bacterium]